MTGPAVPPADTVPPDDSTLRNRAARGAAVTFAAQGGRIALQVLSVVILARLLSPRDYGLLAMVMVVLGVADVFRDLGLSTAAIQARTLSAQQRSNLFWLNTAFGLVLSVLAWALAPALAGVYGQPELVGITQALAWTFLLNGTATQHRANLTRRLQFGRLAVADVVSPVAGLAAAVTLALGGAGYWTLVGQQLVQYAVMLVVVLAAGRWVPGPPDRSVPMGGLLRFGSGMVGTQVIGYLGNNIDSLVIGARFGAGPLGLYNRAFQLLMTPLGQLRGPSTQVVLPVLASLQDDPRRFSSFLQRGQLALGYTLVVGLGLVLGVADPATVVLLGGQWTDVVPLLHWLALAGVFQTLALVNYWVYLARGLTGPLFRYSLVQVVIRVVCIGGGSTFGVVGVAAGFALAPAVSWPLSFWWLSRHTPLPRRELLLGALRILGLTSATAGGAWAGTALAGDLPAAVSLGCGVLTGVAVTLAVVSAVPALRRDVVGVAEVGRLALSRRRTGQGDR
ncbi:lipopolysaccharide biosynthesis protein [Geodermatophilus marinus]|uniref:lipopolysaccharide biosynthesis protein n=1 Tax=Geodermatophilus sp. LHW52908 TaxID=2303986 RepID=UPI000E3DF185|nr:lipopolysaccharide biosynthesis protein [Geodermatophilus sp. LHW52908]RFU22796.1 lipopolysaccharide biosynthesis protein [Geodermatophilus sp. LHW52908]